MAERERFEAVIVGGGHNGLVAATLLARAGRSVLVLERRDRVGGAAVSGSPFPGVGPRLSRYSYLVSLFPKPLLRTLGLAVELRPRRVASYTPIGDSGLLVSEPETTRESMTAITGDRRAFDCWQRFYAMLAGVAARLFPTLTEPLRSREEVRRLVGDEAAWRALFEEPLSETLEATFGSDLLRGVALTDATIGTFAAADDPQLRQNRCFLYHVIGNGTGRWDVPVGGMGALTDALRECALRSGARLRTRAEAVSITSDGLTAEVDCADGGKYQSRHLLAGIAPAVLARLMGMDSAGAVPEGSQLKINMLLKRLPRVRDARVPSSQAFAGTFHVNEGYAQLQRSYTEASAGKLPSVPPCELYCHSLTDPSILSADLRAAGAHTLTLFGLHMPARLFWRSPGEAKEAAVAATLSSLNSVLAEPIEDSLWLDRRTPCVEALTPPELEGELGMPGGHIFHRDLTWPFAESEQEVGSWGVETEYPNVWICGAGARRGGGVSGIPGYNAARAVLAAAARRSPGFDGAAR